MTDADSIASLKTRREVRSYLAGRIDALIGGRAQRDISAEFSDLVTGSDREVIESYRRLDKSCESRSATDARHPGAAMSQSIRDLFAIALQRMKELPPDPRETLHAKRPSSRAAAASTQEDQSPQHGPTPGQD
jgi:hypothetical protein